MSAFDTTKTTTTTLPTWFTNAQQNIASQATSQYGALPTPGQTAGATAAATLGGEQNPFTQAMGTLNQVAQGAAASPWLPSGETNPASPLGQLFEAQNKQLNQILPAVTAKEGAAGIGGGNYGSLRGMTATDTARAGALNTLATAQNKAALDAMTQATQAAIGEGQVGTQYGTTGINLGNYQMSGGLPALAKYSDIINAMGPNTDKTSVAKSNAGLSNNLAAAGNLLQTLGNTAGNFVQGNTGIGWLDQLLAGNGSGGTYTGSPGGLNTSNIDYGNLAGKGGTQADYLAPDGTIIGTGTAVGEGE